MDVLFPGSVIKRQGKSAEEFLNGLFFATKGLILSQVKEITGLDTPVIQNWTFRGWVQKPVDKRYSIDHLARIMIINMLRTVTKLENIANILTYINGDADDPGDDIISESKLYIYICDILDTITYETIFSEERLDKIISDMISEYHEPFSGAYNKLHCGIKIILTYYAASIVKTRADKRAETAKIV